MPNLYLSDKKTRPRHGGRSGWSNGSLALLCLLIFLPGIVHADPSSGRDGADRTWGLGWDDGLTLRRWLGDWELGLAAGPDDYLMKEEYWAWDGIDPEQAQGRLELPLDEREEHGWIRWRTGRLLVRQDKFAVTAFLGLTYEWIDHQERVLALDELVGDYDTFELDRFTDYWILEAGLRPSWMLTDRLSCEFSFGLRYVWERWDQKITTTWAGIEDPDHSLTEGHGRLFQDFGWEGTTSLGFILWL